MTWNLVATMAASTVPSFLRILRLPPRCDTGWTGLLRTGGKNSTNQLRSSECWPCSVMVLLVEPNWVHLAKTCLNGCVLLGNATATLNSFVSVPSPPKQKQAVREKICKGVSTKKSDDNSKEVVCLQKACQNVCALAICSSHHCLFDNISLSLGRVHLPHKVTDSNLTKCCICQAKPDAGYPESNENSLWKHLWRQTTRTGSWKQFVEKVYKDILTTQL